MADSAGAVLTGGDEAATSELGFAVFTPPVFTPGASAEVEADSAADEWLEFKPPTPTQDSDGEDAAADELEPEPEPVLPCGPGGLPGLSSPDDGAAEIVWMGDDSGDGDLGGEWKWKRRREPPCSGADEFTAGMEFSAPPGMGFLLPEEEQVAEPVGDGGGGDGGGGGGYWSGGGGEAEAAPTSFWGASGAVSEVAQGSGSPGTEDDALHEEPSPNSASSTGAGASDGLDDDATDPAGAAVAAARAAQTARLAAQIARLKRAPSSIGSTESADADDAGADQPPAVVQGGNADDDETEGEFDP